MQYKISPTDHLASPGAHRTWQVIGFQEKKGDTLSWGVITRFNTEEQARDYIAVQERIEVKCKRLDADRRNFKVLINGEHRATFRKRIYRKGYDLQGADGNDIAIRIGSDITQADFELVVRTAIAADKVPTLYQIERSQRWHEAWEENRKRDQERRDRAAQVRREVLEGALMRYLDDPRGADKEHQDKAAAMLQGLRNGSGWL